MEGGCLGSLQLMFNALVPSGGKMSMEQLCSRDFGDLLPSLSIGQCQLSSLRDRSKTHDLSQLVTVVVTTSPCRSDPEHEILETLFASLELAGLSSCRKILVCDHFEDSGCDWEFGTRKAHVHYKAGSLPSANIQRYRQRISEIKQTDWASEVEVLELESWHCNRRKS